MKEKEERQRERGNEREREKERENILQMKDEASVHLLNPGGRIIHHVTVSFPDHSLLIENGMGSCCCLCLILRDITETPLQI